MSQIPLRIATAVLAASAALALWAGPGAEADDPAPVPIAAAPDLTWGFKQSWRVYTGAPQVDGGATLSAGTSSDPYALSWEFESGSYDGATGETVLRYAGTAHWQKYYLPSNPALNDPPPGYSGPLDIHLLDVTMSDPVVTIGPDSATISVEASSRQLDTWELLDTGRVDVVQLDVDGLTPVVDAGTTTWSAIPAFTTESANPVFAGNYPAGRAVDAVGFSYSGPGGPPDLSEDWDAPGSTKLSLTDNEIVADTQVTSQYAPWWIDRERRIVHLRFNNLAGPGTWTYRAFSLDTMAMIGEPLTLPSAERIVQTSLVDTSNGRIFYGRSGESALARWIGYDVAEGKYVLGAPAQPFPLVGVASALAWDAVGERAFNVRRMVPDGVSSTSYDEHVWQLNTYTEQSDGTWLREAYDLPSFPAGLNRRGYPDAGNGSDVPPGLAARDGSLILLGNRRTSVDPATIPEPATVPGAWRVRLDGGQAEVTAIPATAVENSIAGVFDALRPGPDGQVTLFRIGATGGPANIVQTLTVAEDGATVAAGPQTTLGDLDPLTWDAFAVDPEDGTAWIGGYQSQRIVGVRDGRVVADQYFAERHPRGGPVIAGTGHVVHAQTNDGSPPTFGGSPIYGFGKFERLGWSPRVTGDPQPATVTLAAAEASEQAQFHSTATADPAPARQWQVKRPGKSRFVDLDGETGATLAVAAERAMGGSQYRAVYSNAAGRTASEPASLAVDYAPEIAIDAADVSVPEGEPAVFQVLSRGEPEPDVVWQRRSEGFWRSVDPADGDFAVGEGTLTVLETNRDQSGALFRAKADNDVGTVYSRAAKLTVEPSAGIPPGGLSLDGVSLDWTGSHELQRMAPNMQPHYFSAGASDGGEASYGASAAGVRVLHRAPGGALTPASWATRAAQATGGVEQVVRLTDGHAEVEPDGSATVTWDGAFSVNFYGGLVPFTVSRPELTVAADGTGTLRGDLSGYGASQADPSDRHPVAPVDDVVIATFSGVEVDPFGVVAVEPDYAGVEIDAPAGFGAQDRLAPGWGAWPQPFVDFHGATGLAPYWYSSGGAFDPHKPADPFTVDFTGAGSLPPLGPGGDALPPPAADRPSTTRVTLGRARYGRATPVTVRVAVAGVAATGEVRVRVAGRTVTRRLRDGVARLSLPAGIRPGSHAVRARYDGAPGVSASSARATLRVAKATPRVSLAVRRRAAAARLVVVARIPRASVHPTGQLVVRDRGRIVVVEKLSAARRGRIALVLGRLRPGAHFLRVTLAGNSRQHAATSAYRTVRVR